MTARDRLAGAVVGAVVLLAAFWFLVLAPKRKDAQALGAKVAQAQQRLDTARQAAAAGSAARGRYDADYAAVARLGKAVPADDDVASLVYQLDHAANGTHIDFRSIALSSSGSPAPAAAPPAAQAAAVGQASGDSSSSSSSTPATPATGMPASQSAAAGLPPGSTVGSAGFPTMPFDFAFDGRFFNMESFFAGIQRFASFKRDGVTIRGRLLTVDAFSLTAASTGFPKVKAKIKATAYLVPEAEGATGGATPAGPSTAATAGAPAAATGTSSPAAPAAATSIVGGAR
jgi:hypothetical protein